MENFKSNFYNKKNIREVITNIFPNEGRNAFSKKVKETFNWSQNGGPKIGTPLFIKGVVGKVNLNSEELLIVRKEIKKEIDRIKKEKNKIIKDDISNENELKEQKIKDSDILKASRKHLEEELKRSGGIDPNEI